MTDEEEDEIDYSDDDSDNSGFFKWLQTVVVVFALCGFFGLAWYAYKSGDNVDDKDVELIKVDKAPVKEAPTNPGGMEIPNQDKTVYGLIDGNKTDKPVVERIMPAPEEPVTANNESEAWMSNKLKNQNDADKNSSMMNAPILKEVDKAPAKTSEQFSPEKPQQVATADTTQAPVLDAKATPAPEATQTPAPAPAKTEQPASATPAPAHASKESKEDDDDAQDAAETKTPAPAVSAPAVTSTTGLPKNRIQLAALGSQAEADKVWQQLVKKFPDELGSKQHYVVHVTVKGKQYYRLQAAPMQSSQAAEQLCMTLVSSGQACILAK